jgi:ABC-type transport system involved in cytochrome c biogenesis permease component
LEKSSRFETLIFATTAVLIPIILGLITLIIPENPNPDNENTNSTISSIAFLLAGLLSLSAIFITLLNTYLGEKMKSC